jgi:hypothetical protein
MNNFTFISLHIIYFVFAVLLINTIRKEFISQGNKKILKINSKDIFIPDNTTYNELYIQKFVRNNIKLKYISILPFADGLVSKNGLWNLVRSQNLGNLYDFFPKSYILENKEDENKLYNDIKNSNGIKIYFLKKNIESKKGIKIFRLLYKKFIFDLQSIYLNEGYKLVQEMVQNPFLYRDRLNVLRVYIFIMKDNLTIKFFKFKWSKVLFAPKNYNIMDDESLITCSKEQFGNINLEMLVGKNYLNVETNIKTNLKFLFNVSRNYLLRDNLLPDTRCFQLFGLDYMLDSFGKPYLLEINKNPNLTNNFSKEEEKMKEILVSEMYSIVRGEIDVDKSNYELVS